MDLIHMQQQGTAVPFLRPKVEKCLTHASPKSKARRVCKELDNESRIYNLVLK